MTVADFAALLDVARARGVSQFECDGVRVTFAYVEQPTATTAPRPAAIAPEPDVPVPAVTSESFLHAKIRELRAAEADMFPVVGGEP